MQRSEGDRLWPAWTRFACPGRSAHGAPWCGPPTPSETKKSFSGGKSSSYSYKFLQLEDSNHMFILQDSSSCSCFQVKQLWFSFPNTSERGRVRKNNILDMIYFWCGILWYTNMCIHTYIYIHHGTPPIEGNIHRHPPVGNTMDAQVQIIHYVLQSRRERERKKEKEKTLWRFLHHS